MGRGGDLSCGLILGRHPWRPPRSAGVLAILAALALRNPPAGEVTSALQL